MTPILPSELEHHEGLVGTPVLAGEHPLVQPPSLSPVQPPDEDVQLPAVENLEQDLEQVLPTLLP